MRKIALAIASASLTLGALACIATNNGPPDASTGEDASAPDTSVPDSTVEDAGPDTNVVDGGPDTNVIDAGPDACAAILASMLAAPIQPPHGWFGFDLSNGGAADGGLGSGGLTIDQAKVLACANAVEPDTLEAGVPPFQPGSRAATFGGGAINIDYNIESRVMWLVSSTGNATGTLTFHSRAHGAYDEPDGGTHTYVAGYGPNGDGGMGYLTRDGVDFPADWNPVVGDGTTQASAWANEIYDGLMATYAPSAASVADCLSTRFLGGPLAVPVPACMFNQTAGVLSVRPLGFYLVFNQGTNQTAAMYEFWPGGAPTCSTPQAEVDLLDYSNVQPAGGPLDPSVGTSWWGTTVGSIVASEPISNSQGLLATEANTLEGCDGVTATAPDPGYGAEQWGPSGEVELEYNLDSGVAYKLFAKAGFKGSFGFPGNIQAAESDGGTNTYVIALGTLTKNGLPVTLDWSQGDAGTLNAALTDISNAWWYLGDTDCVQAGDCAIVPDDQNGHSTFTLLSGPAVVQQFGGAYAPLTIVFPQGTSVPSEIYTTNSAGAVQGPPP